MANEVRLVLEKEKKEESVPLLKSWGEIVQDGGLKSSSRYVGKTFACSWPGKGSLGVSSNVLLRSTMIPESGFDCWNREQKQDTTIKAQYSYAICATSLSQQ